MAEQIRAEKGDKKQAGEKETENRKQSHMVKEIESQGWEGRSHFFSKSTVPLLPTKNT